MRAESWSAGMGQGPGLACVPAIAIERGPAAAMAGSEGEGRPWFLGCSGVLGGGGGVCLCREWGALARTSPAAGSAFALLGAAWAESSADLFSRG